MGRLSGGVIGLTLCAAAALLTACDAAKDDGGGTPAATDQAVADPTVADQTAAPDSPLAGAWIARYERSKATENLKAAGLGKWADRFFAAEKWPPTGEYMSTVYSFTPTTGDADGWEGAFDVAYFETPGAWHVGWYGRAQVTGEEVEMFDEYSQTTDVYRWSVEGEELTLRKVSSDARELKGLAPEVYDAAYLTDPLVRTDCPMEPLTDCPE